MRTHKVCIITGSRAEWGLFYPLAEQLRKDPRVFSLSIIATAAHLDPRFGSTYREIIRDGFSIAAKVPLPRLTGTRASLARAMSAGVMKISQALGRVRPDLVVLLGDRFETLAAAIACLSLGIPVAHISGGERTAGSIDDLFRHMITKAAALHFVSTDQYRRRVIQMGEHPRTVFTVGALGIDNIRRTKRLPLREIERRTGISLKGLVALITFNPGTALTQRENLRQFTNLLRALDRTPEVRAIFTHPNPDLHTDALSRKLKDYVRRHQGKTVLVRSLGRELYLNAARRIAFVAGNSSSGIVEIPSLGIPSVNIGPRQDGRIMPRSVIQAGGSARSIQQAFRKALSPRFRAQCRRVRSPYGDGSAAARIVKHLRALLPLTVRQKVFFDLPQRSTHEN